MSRPISFNDSPQAAAQRFRAAPFAAPDGGRLGEADSGRGVRVCVARLQLIFVGISGWFHRFHHITNWKITMFNGKTHYKWPCSIAMLV